MALSADSYTRSLWASTCEEPAPEVPQFTGQAEVDAAVVGGGITGLSAALALAEAGARVAVLEAHGIGWGASGRNGGQVIPGVKLDPSELVARFGEARGEALADAVGGAADHVFALVERHGISCAPVRAGWIQAAHAAPALERVLCRAREWQARGAPVELLDGSALERRTGARGYHGGWRDGRAGTLQPLAYTRGLARAALAAGAALHGSSPVTRLGRRDGAWLLETPSGRLRAGAVILGTDGYTDALLPGLRQTLLLVQSIQVATGPLPEAVRGTLLSGGECVSETRRLAFYFRRSPDHRVVFGGRGAMGEAESPALFAALAAALRRTLPGAAALPLAHRWSGQVALTLDGLPRLHEPAPGLFVGLGYNGRGVAMATLMGRWLAERLHAGTAPPLPATPVEPIPWHAARKPVIAAGIALAWAQDRLGRAA